MVGLENLMLERKEIDNILRESAEKFKNGEISSVPLDEFIRRNQYACMTTRELATVCREGKMIALTNRNDDDNTKYATELCEYVYKNNPGAILYFTLKQEYEEFKSMYPRVNVELDDIAALSIEELVSKVKDRNKLSRISMIVIDNLCLMTTKNILKTKREENEELLLKFKQLSLQENIAVVVLLAMSKYSSKNCSIHRELEAHYGDYLSAVNYQLDVMPEMIGHPDKEILVRIGVK